jgi:hypothetical protein
MCENRKHALMFVSAVLCLGLAGTAAPVRSQDLICCNQFVDADGPWKGARRDCKKALEELPPASRASACERYRKLSRTGWFSPYAEGSTIQIGCCLEAGDVCGPIPAKCNAGKKPNEENCEPAPTENNNPPWLGNDASCTDRQRATISWSQRRTSNPNLDVSFTIAICGEVIRYIVPGSGYPENYPGARYVGARSFDVCCESWRNAAESGSPCDARADIDCDGETNEKDRMPEYSFRDPSPADFVSGPMTNLPFWQDLYPYINDGSTCDCKWELIRVDYTCKHAPNMESSNRTGGRRWDATYKYEATWKCPKGGKTSVTRNTVVKKGLQCPNPPNRTWP